MSPDALKDLALTALETLKAQDVTVLDVRNKASFADYMIVASGTSDRHLKAMADQVHIDAKKAGSPPLSTEGQDSRNWILVDLGDVIVHLMKPETRALYELEKLWSIGPNRSHEST
ncbi:ribosome silencing factor [Cardiobacteriales bacterium ML27]|uniref:Ribosomal silencing factor RsfS n=1 Tax=Ostreibacterium oceani TaxID=2654998 RepID=A0A6N7EYA8_9GAMM|nr:ribosome silencing factor [Ostreibacterium oceani]